MKIASGSYSARVVYKADDEIGELASAINKMAETLEARLRMPEPQTDEKNM
jgi:HAMP domain-containing protein